MTATSIYYSADDDDDETKTEKNNFHSCPNTLSHTHTQESQEIINQNVNDSSALFNDSLVPFSVPVFTQTERTTALDFTPKKQAS